MTHARTGEEQSRAGAYPARDDMAVVGFVAITLVKRTDHEPLD